MRHGIVGIAAGILFLYLFLNPEIDAISCVILIGIWASSMAWDLQVTFANKSYIPRYEQSFVLRFACRKFSQNRAIAVIIVIETCVHYWITNDGNIWN